MSEKKTSEEINSTKTPSKPNGIVKTGMICALVGAIGGGFYVDETQEESNEAVLKQLNDHTSMILDYYGKEIQKLKEEAEPYGNRWNTLKSQIYRLDSLNKELKYTIKDISEKSNDMEKTIREQKEEIVKYEKEFGGRYSMEKEFALLYECLYGSNQNYSSYSSYGYSRYRDCCVKAVRQLQKQYPTEKKLQEWQSVSKFKCKD